MLSATTSMKPPGKLMRSATTSLSPANASKTATSLWRKAKFGVSATRKLTTTSANATLSTITAVSTDVANVVTAVGSDLTDAVADLATENAATQVQAAFRGFKDRQRLSQNRLLLRFNPGQRAAAAQRIQAHLRGFKIRRGPTVYDASAMLHGLAADVSLPTPNHLWYGVDVGWPQQGWSVPGSGRTTSVPPEHIAPTLIETAALAPLQGEVIGELRLEVLEAKGLPKTDICSACDPYALVVHEGVAARTVAVLNTSSPRWPPGWPRAFKFPIVHPSSLVQIALMDDDRGSGVKLDDPLGRVVLSLAGRFPRTEYDAWFPLQYERGRVHVSSCGQLRLRFSVCWADDALPLRRTLTPPPSYDLVVISRRYLEAVRFTTRGGVPEDEYSIKVLLSYVKEAQRIRRRLTLAAQSLKAALMQWTHPFLSSVLLVLGQLICMHPPLLLATLPLALVLTLSYTYRASPSSSCPSAALRGAASDDLLLPANQRLDSWSLLKVIVAGRLRGSAQLPVLDACAPNKARGTGTKPTSSTKEASNGGSAAARGAAAAAACKDAAVAESDEEDALVNSWKAARKTAAAHARARKAHAAGAMSAQQLAEELELSALEKDLARVEDAMVAARRKVFLTRNGLLEDTDDADLPHVKHDWVAERQKVGLQDDQVVTDALADVMKTVTSAFDHIDPLRIPLTPVQQSSLKLLRAYRMLHSVLTWENPMLTMWLYLGLVGLCLALCLLPLASPRLMQALAHLACFVALGPHHWLIDRVREHAAERWRARIAAYDAAGPVEQGKILKVETNKLRARVDRRCAKLERQELRRRRRVKGDEMVFERAVQRRWLLRDARFSVSNEPAWTVAGSAATGPHGETPPLAMSASPRVGTSADGFCLPE